MEKNMDCASSQGKLIKMKKLLILLLSIISIAGFSQTASTDAALTTQANTTILGQSYSPVRASDMFKAIINSKLSVFAKQKTVSTTTYTLLNTDVGYVIHCTHASGVTITMPNTIATDATFTFIREGGQVTFTDDGTSVLNTPGSEFEIQVVNGWASFLKKDATNFYGIGTLGPAFSLTNGEGTTANGTAVDLGGTFANDISVSSSTGNAFLIGSSGGGNSSEVDIGAGSAAISSTISGNTSAVQTSSSGVEISSGGNPAVTFDTDGSWDINTDGSGTSGQILTSNGSSSPPTWEDPTSSGTVTSVALTMPGIFNVSGSPVTTSGTLAASFVNQNANIVFAGPATGSAASPAFRSLVVADIPSLTSLYEVPLTFSTGLTRSTNTVTVNTSQNISTLSNLTTNGIVTTSGGTGSLSVTSTTGSGNVVLASGATLTNPIVGTQSANDNSTKAASTAYADAKVAEAITNGVTGIAPSEDQVFDALALKLSTALAQGSFIVGNSSNVATAYRLGYVTPEMYGAVRDGSTDDATSITNAFGSGLPVYFGPGNYRIASGISVPAGATAYGFGEATIISTTQTTINMFTLNGRASLTGIKFLGSDQSGQIGIVVSDVISTSTEVGNVLENCRFVDLRYGIQGANVYSANFEGAIQATNCQFISNSIGVWLQAGAEYNKFTNCSSVGNTTGVRWDAGNNLWNGGQITNNTTGVQFNTGSNAGKFQFTGVAINHNTTAVLSNGITITGEFIGCNFISASKLDITTSYIRFIGCYFNDTSQQAWSFTNSTSIVDVINCRFGMTSANQPTVTQSGTAVQFTGCIWESGVIPSYAVGTIQGSITQTPFAATGTYTNWTQNGSLTASSGTSQSYIGYNMTPTYNTTSTFTGTAAGFRYAATRTSVTGLSEYPIITNGGLHGIGTLTPTETFHVVGRGATSSTYNALFQNSTPSNVLAIRDDGAMQFGSAGSRPSIYASAGTSTVSNSGASLTINASNANANSVFINNGLTQYANVLGLGGSFTNSSGTQSMTIFKISNTFNNTGTYAGTIVDLDINNTETSMTGTTHYGILERSTTALSAFGLSNPTAKLEIGAGTSSTGFFKFTSSTDLSSPAAGHWYYDGTRLGFSPSTTIKRVSLTNDVAPSNGQVPIGNGTDYTVANITGSNGVSVTNGSGTIALAATSSIPGTTTNDNASSGNIGEEVNSTVSTYTNFTTTATYQNITSITLTAGDWDLSAFFTYSSNSATITGASNAIFVISTTTASASGATEGKNISYVPQAALLGTSLFSDAIAPYRVSINATTTYYLNAQATFTVGNPQYVGGLRARRMR